MSNYTEMYVYEDGEFIGEVRLDPNNKEEVDYVMDTYFDNTDWERSDSGDEIYIGLSETQYMVNK